MEIIIQDKSKYFKLFNLKMYNMIVLRFGNISYKTYANILNTTNYT